MKIEIELSELESLRKDLLNQKEINIKLENKLKELDESELKQSAVKLAYHLTDCYLKAIFTKLGFDDSRSGLVVNSNLEHYIGKRWYHKLDEIKVEVGVNILNNFRRAFIDIGVVPKIEDKEEFDYSLSNNA